MPIFTPYNGIALSKVSRVSRKGSSLTTNQKPNCSAPHRWDALRRCLTRVLSGLLDLFAWALFDIRFHYRIIAGARAMCAAALLPDNTAELADVVNTAGRWVADRDDKVANRYHEQLELRCAKTNIGRSAMARHWFVDAAGPWSREQAASREAMRQELGIQGE
jgi:hypothetical protein